MGRIRRLLFRDAREALELVQEYGRLLSGRTTLEFDHICFPLQAVRMTWVSICACREFHDVQENATCTDEFMNNLNWTTTAALLGWPVLSFFMYQTRSVTRATLWTILGAYMLLPVGADIKFKMIPDLDKSTIPNLAALFGCVVLCGRSIRPFKGFGLPEFLIVVLMICPFITCELNGDPIFVGNRFLPGLFWIVMRRDRPLSPRRLY